MATCSAGTGGGDDLEFWWTLSFWPQVGPGKASHGTFLGDVTGRSPYLGYIRRRKVGGHWQPILSVLARGNLNPHWTVSSHGQSETEDILLWNQSMSCSFWEEDVQPWPNIGCWIAGVCTENYLTLVSALPHYHVILDKTTCLFYPQLPHL